MSALTTLCSIQQLRYWQLRVLKQREAQTVGLELVGREELLKQMQKKADELIISYEGERRKRSRFQYDIGVQAKQGYAQTSLERARIFNFEIRKLLRQNA